MIVWRLKPSLSKSRIAQTEVCALQTRAYINMGTGHLQRFILIDEKLLCRSETRAALMLSAWPVF